MTLHDPTSDETGRASGERNPTKSIADDSQASNLSGTWRLQLIDQLEGGRTRELGLALLSFLFPHEGRISVQLGASG